MVRGWLSFISGYPAATEYKRKVDDNELKAGLRRLGLDSGSSRVLALLPLVIVAWADGTVQRSERREIERIAADMGLAPTEREQQVLRRWLSAAPGRAEQRIGLHVLDALARTAGGDDWQPEALDAVVGLCFLVAEAAGGMFGLAEPISDTERAAISDIARRLGVGDTGTWKHLYRAGD